MQKGSTNTHIHTHRAYDHIPAVKWPHLLKFSGQIVLQQQWIFPPSCSPSSEIQQSSAELIGLTSKRLISPYTDKTLLNITFHAWHYNLVLIMQLVLRLWTHNISKELVQALKCFPAAWAWRYILRFSGKSCVFWGGGGLCFEDCGFSETTDSPNLSLSPFAFMILPHIATDTRLPLPASPTLTSALWNGRWRQKGGGIRRETERCSWKINAS